MTEAKKKTMKRKEIKQAVSCDDKNCPVHGRIKVRGRHFTGDVKKIYAKTATIEWQWSSYIAKYERYRMNRSRIKVHVPECMDVQVGDVVRVWETKPISKTKSFVVVSKVK